MSAYKAIYQYRRVESEKDCLPVRGPRVCIGSAAGAEVECSFCVIVSTAVLGFSLVSANDGDVTKGSSEGGGMRAGAAFSTNLAAVDGAVDGAIFQLGADETLVPQDSYLLNPGDPGILKFVGRWYFLAKYTNMREE